MSGLKCLCGNNLSNTTDPTDDMIHIWRKADITKSLSHNPTITAMDFYNEQLDGKYEFWYCHRCRRIFQVDIHTGLIESVYIPGNHSVINEDMSNWEPLYETDDKSFYEATEKNIDIPLQQIVDEIFSTYYISPNRKTVSEKKGDNWITVYKKEEVVIPLD